MPILSTRIVRIFAKFFIDVILLSNLFALTWK